METINLSPTPSSLIESMRDIGYTIETAIADIVDNSITAKAKSINIRFDQSQNAPWLAVVDDGIGMTKEELVAAMRLGSRNPLDTRPSNDLGRFGLGLKTAAFSQCRRLSVLSKRDNLLSCAKWDLDLVSSSEVQPWPLCIFSDDEILKHSIFNYLLKEYLSDSVSGTIVLWENIDRVVDNAAPRSLEKFFDEKIVETRTHLELVFHRYLKPDPGDTKISIAINNSPLNAYDPFFCTKSTELREEEFLYEGEAIKVQPFVLPHHSKVNKTEWARYAGKQGYLQEQGFYVYRNRRLIIFATWFRMIRKEELTKLLRVRVDIPNTLDHLWKIDVKKSNAQPPNGVKNELKRIIGQIEISGKKVYRQKGQRLTPDLNTPIWLRTAKDNQVFYELNRNHQVLKKFAESLSEDQYKVFFDILSTIECTFPRASFFNDSATKPEQMPEPSLDDSQFRRLVQVVCGAEDHSSGVNRYNELILIEPFASNKEATKKAMKEIGFEF